MPTLLLILVTVVWGSTFVIIKDTVRSVDVSFLVFARILIAALAMTVYMLLKDRRQFLDLRAWRQGLLLGFLLTVIYGSQTLGLRYTSSGHSAFITSAAVVAVPILLFVFFRQRIPIREWPSILGVFLGLFLLTYDFTTRINAGDAITLVTTGAYALHIVLSGRFVKTTASLPLIHAQFAGAAFTSFGLFLLSGARVGVMGTKGMYAVVYLGVVGTLFCYFVSVWAQKHVSSIKVVLLFSLEPLFAVCFGYLFMREELSFREMMGGLIMLAGVVAYQLLAAQKSGRASAEG